MTGLPPELVAAVLADPESDVPRLVCADWLDEAGRADDAAFVRAQVRLDRADRLGLAPAEVERLRVAEAGLIARNHARWLAELLGEDAVAAQGRWNRGFLVRVSVGTWPAEEPAAEGFADPEILRRLAAAPLLESVSVGLPWPLPAGPLAHLPDLPRLRELRLFTVRHDLGEADFRRLAEFPRLGWPHLMVRAGEGFTTWFHAPEMRRVEELRRERLRARPDAELLDAVGPLARECRRSRCGRVALSTGQRLDLTADVLARLPGLAHVELDGAGAPDWLASHPGLLGLRLRVATPHVPGPLAGLRELRYASVSGDRELEWGPIADWLAGLPRLAALAIHYPGPGLTQAHLRAIVGNPALRSLTLRNADRELRVPIGGLLEYFGENPLEPPGRRKRALRGVWRDQHMPADEAAALARAGVWRVRNDENGSPLGRASRVGGVSIRPPAWAKRVSPTLEGPAEPLAAWSEWGDGSPEDRLVPGGPMWLQLERLPFAATPEQSVPLLTTPPGTLAAASYWDDPVTGDGGRVSIGGACPFAWHRRYLWPGRGVTLRLRAEWPWGRVLPLADVARAVADSVTGPAA